MRQHGYATHPDGWAPLDGIGWLVVDVTSKLYKGWLVPQLGSCHPSDGPLGHGVCDGLMCATTHLWDGGCNGCQGAWLEPP